ncbi:MAG TPA: sulfotransferase [Solirubrobacteraceae bacterium]|nr:sulfotransferase [Solirubrobacteraceae bacterium]
MNESATTAPVHKGVTVHQGVMLAPPPPVCPPGWRTGAPDFVGVGAQRSGTTWWFDLVVAHPGIEAPPATRKELHYFDRFHAGGFTAADAVAYGDYFPRPEGRLTGEWTPVYLAAPWAPAMLAAAACEAKLLVILRDPIERYLSGLQRHHRTAHATGAPLNAMAPLEAFMRGFYHAQLTHLLAHFERSRVLILQYERCVRDPLEQLRRTFAFLGVDDGGFTPDLAAHPNRQPQKPELHPDARRALVEAYAPDVAALSDRFPEIDVALWPNFAHLG